MSESDDDAPVESFFSKRADFIVKKSPEDMKAAAELFEKHMSAAEAEPVCKKGRKRKLPSDPAGTESDLMSDLNDVKLSAAAKRRLKKVKDAEKKDLELMDALNAPILSSEPSSDILIIPQPENSDVVPESKTMKLTIRYLRNYGRFECVKDENFVEVFKNVGDYFGIKASEFLLCLADRNIALCDTPNSLSIAPSDILEVIPYKFEGRSHLDDPNYVLLLFQSNDTKIKTEMIVSKMEKFEIIMERYAEKRNLPLKDLKFEFDGDKLIGYETPEDLDMDVQSVIDVRVPIAVAQCSKSGSESPVAGCSYANDSPVAGYNDANINNSPVAGCSYAINNSPVAGCSYANNNNSPVAGCSYANNDNDSPVSGSSNGKAQPIPSYLDDFLIVDTDSNDSDVVVLD